MKGYPKWFSVTMITTLMSLLMITGYLLAPTTLELKLQWALPWRLGVEQRTFVAAAHAIMALVIFSLMGSLWTLHMRQEWKRGESRFSGIGMVASLALLGLTGVGIYYFGDEKLSQFSSLSHLGLGIWLTIVYFAHVFLNRR